MEKNDKFQTDNNENNNIEIINGNGENLNISPVYDHIKMEKPNKTKDKNKKIVIPKS